MTWLSFYRKLKLKGGILLKCKDSNSALEYKKWFFTGPQNLKHDFFGASESETKTWLFQNLRIENMKFFRALQSKTRRTMHKLWLINAYLEEFKGVGGDEMVLLLWKSLVELHRLLAKGEGVLSLGSWPLGGILVRGDGEPLWFCCPPWGEGDGLGETPLELPLSIECKDPVDWWCVDRLKKWQNYN